VAGYIAEKLDKELLILTKAIKSDGKLNAYLSQHLPGISKGMDNRIKQGLNRGIDFDLER
jgi:hypothetical protein